MPNWCFNYVDISHSDRLKTVELFNKLKQNVFFNYVKPCPTELFETEAGCDTTDGGVLERKHQENKKKYGYAHWYDYCNDQWGTKWEAQRIECEFDHETDDVLKVQFETAWCPPTGVYEKLIEQGFKVTAIYHDEGDEYAGKFIDGYHYEFDRDQILQGKHPIAIELDGEFNISENYA
jgi:hypothetical protein